MLEVASQVLLANNSTLLKKNQLANSLQQLIVPLNSAASKLLRETTKTAAPIGGCQRYHCTREAERKKEASRQIDLHTNMGLETTVSIQHITEYLCSSSTHDGLHTQAQATAH